MLESEYEFTIHKDKDVDLYRKDFDKINKVKLVLPKACKITQNKFDELFERLSVTKIEYFQLDMTEAISSTTLSTADMLYAINKCIRCWNLKTFILQIPHLKLSNDQVDGLIYESLRNMTNLENLYVDLSGCVDTHSIVARAFEKLIPRLKSLENIFINMKECKLAKEEMNSISNVIKHVKVREFLF